MAFWKWSRTASSNAAADNTINWAEGMAPSAVNDSARAMMARLAEWRDDVSGTIATAGISTAYTVASNQGFDNFADMNGAMIAFAPHTTNGPTVTLNVDGLGARPLRFGPGPTLELQSGVLIAGTPYVASYNNTDGSWYLQGGFANPYGIPLGGVLPYTGPFAPNSAFVFPSGQFISRSTYASYFALVGTTFGAGDGSTTFNVPDLRGRAIFGLDLMNGAAAGRITVAGGNFDGRFTGATGGVENHTLSLAEMPAHTHPGSIVSISDPGHTHNLQAAAGLGFANPTVAEGNGNVGPLTNGAGLNTTGITATPTIASQGGGGIHTILNPAMTLPYILRII
jgi:microcystin-dependent protein